MDKNSYVYLDYAATAPLCEEAACAMEPYQVPGRDNLLCNANANALHSLGRAAFAALEQARHSVAASIGARRPDEVIFTGSATEADNMALVGLTHAACDRLRRRGLRDLCPCVITSAIEHEAVLQPAEQLHAEGIELVKLMPTRQGFIEPECLQDAISVQRNAGRQVVLVSVQAANSELGSVQPIAELARLAHEAGALFHTDAVQAIGKVPFCAQTLGVDAASFAAHKVGGPKGVGALYLKAQTPCDPLVRGGGQEAGRRSGTQNVASIVGFAAALQASVQAQETEARRLRVLRDRLYAALSTLAKVRPTVQVPEGSCDFLPNIVSVLVEGFESETLVLQLDAQGFAVSGGSACSSRSHKASHVLTSCGLSADEAQGVLRISFGRYTSEADIDGILGACTELLGKKETA